MRPRWILVHREIKSNSWAHKGTANSETSYLATWYHYSWQSYSFFTILELLEYSKLTKPLSYAHSYHGGCSLKSNSINIQFPKHTKADDNRIELAISCVKTMKKILGEVSATKLHLLQPPEKRWKDMLLLLPVEPMSFYCMTSSEECFHIEHESECPASTSCYYMFFKNRPYEC